MIDTGLLAGAALTQKPPSEWPFFRRLVRGMDFISRKVQRITEFDSSDDCLLRIGIRSAKRELTLSDGMHVHPGDPVVELHLWNEHLAIPPSGLDLRWASTARQQFERSLERLAEHISRDPSLRNVRAVMVTPAFSPRQQQKNLRRLPYLLGGEWTAVANDLGLIYGWIDSLWLWLLVWTFNPHSLANSEFLRRREEFWMSRERFVFIYRARSEAKANRIEVRARPRQRFK